MLSLPTHKTLSSHSTVLSALSHQELNPPAHQLPQYLKVLPLMAITCNATINQLFSIVVNGFFKRGLVVNGTHGLTSFPSIKGNVKQSPSASKSSSDRASLSIWAIDRASCGDSSCSKRHVLLFQRQVCNKWQPRNHSILSVYSPVASRRMEGDRSPNSLQT